MVTALSMLHRHPLPKEKGKSIGEGKKYRRQTQLKEWKTLQEKAKNIAEGKIANKKGKN